MYRRMRVYPRKKKMKHTLYIGSQSPSRQNLLKQADIPFKVLSHDSDECVVRGNSSFDDYVLAIAREKMVHVQLPTREEAGTDEIFVLTADSLSMTQGTKEVLGKPEDRDDAVRMLRLHREQPTIVTTACVLEKKVWDGGWKTEVKKEWCVSSNIEFIVDEEYIDSYLEKLPMALYACGAGIIEGYGHNFVKSITGSFSAVLGLPMYELRQVLRELEF